MNIDTQERIPIVNGDVDAIISQLQRGELISEHDARVLCDMAIEVMSNDPNVAHVSSPVTICGDIHGQFYDLLELFAEGGNVPETSYIFLGDYVDRGIYSVETFLLLIALKVRYPSRMTLLRGNHESRNITQIYGFYDECFRKYGNANVWRYCTNVFDHLTLAAVVDEYIFCVHGGLSPVIKYIDDLQNLNRKEEIPPGGAICDLLWSDPDENLRSDWGVSPRGAGYSFGKNVVNAFNYDNNINLVCRAHQLVNEGYKFVFDQKLVTVWSAPNYCYRCNNLAAILEIDERGNSFFRTFNASPYQNKMDKTTAIPDYFL